MADLLHGKVVRREVGRQDMGFWGPGLFSDDTASDVRADYRQLLEDGMADEAAVQRILDRYADALRDPDDAPSVWLALAVTQSKLGRLDPVVCAQALAAIDTGTDLVRWAADPGLATKRRAVLQKVRAQLTGPQPPRKKVRPPSRHVTDLQPGDVLGYQAASRTWALLRVARIDEHRLSVAPILVILAFDGEHIPPRPELDRLPDRTDKPHRIDGTARPPWSTAVWRVTVHRRVDYAGSGLRRIGHTIARRTDPTIACRTYATWDQLVAELAHYHAHAGPTDSTA
jgi:hypothetical protein